MKLSRTIYAVLILVSGWSFAQAQVGTARLVLSVPQARFLTLAPSSSDVQTVSGVPTAGILHVRVRPQAAGDRVRISLLARSNTAYRVTARVMSGSGLASQLTVRPAAAEPGSGAEHLMPDALNVRFEPASVVSTLGDTPVLEGPRISRRGNSATPGNAVVLTLYVELPGDATGAELMLQMDPRP